MQALVLHVTDLHLFVWRILKFPQINRKFLHSDLEQAVSGLQDLLSCKICLSAYLFSLFIYGGGRLISHSVWQSKCVHKKFALCQELKHSWSWPAARLKIGFTPPTVKMAVFLKNVFIQFFFRNLVRTVLDRNCFERICLATLSPQQCLWIIQNSNWLKGREYNGDVKVWLNAVPQKIQK